MTLPQLHEQTPDGDQEFERKIANANVPKGVYVNDPDTSKSNVISHEGTPVFMKDTITNLQNAGIARIKENVAKDLASGLIDQKRADEILKSLA